MKSRKLVLGLLIMLAFVVSSFTYAYWSSVVLTGNVASNSVTIGEGRTATVTAALGAAGSGTLVPSGQVANSISAAPTTSIVFTFNVTWADNKYTAGAGTVAVVVGSVTNDPAGLVQFTVTGGSPLAITEGVQLVVTVTVTLTEPTTEAQYLAIINAAVTFTVTFTVTPTA